MTAVEAQDPPEGIAAEAKRLGHEIEWDDPYPVRVCRWTCTRCDESVWCEVDHREQQWGDEILKRYCRGKPVPKPGRYAWASGRQVHGFK